MDTGVARIPGTVTKGIWAGPSRPDSLGQCNRCFSRISHRREDGICDNCHIELYGRDAPNNPYPGPKEYQDVKQLDDIIELLYDTQEKWPAKRVVPVISPFAVQDTVPIEDLMPASHNKRVEDESIIAMLLS